jgi:type VI secretion system protein ImpA
MQIPVTELCEAIAADRPCGDDLEDTQLLASFDAFRLFGQAAPLSVDTDWRDIRDRALEALDTSKDFRLLAHLASATLRTEGFAAFAEVVTVASRWLGTWPAEVFPRVDEDAILRRNALNGFADRMAVIDGVRRAPLLVNRQFGPLSIRAIEIATGQLAPAEGEEQAMDAAQVNALLTATEVAELGAVATQLQETVGSLKAIEEAMRSQGGSQAAPDFVALATPLARTLKLFNDHLASRAPAAGDAQSAAEGEAAPAGAGTIAVGGIRTREDATRALDAVAAFFRNNEPSSPIPLLLERAKRLVAKDFLAVLEELAPEALGPAKAASGVRDTSE